ncbi:MYXO-CTERM sorting domain-containing protein [Nannocystis sp. RBIL2]|uniref:MYXO-CTERM sorting domain-containing protein n=1 Tax=Nannocystis sp. RBIL2 TaxID=2996788 RepID=UPI00226F091F|nr:MYXO-CTERM sorting domain-containing protein [Nannocystis sp. RBIL2]MCY1070851.1 MYXO-CTERM sorting domain-containing protein [Nannocystis sp. RBIL2]
MRHRTPRAPQTTALRPAVLAAGLTFFGAATPAAAACVDEATCAVKKPLLLFVLDYSTSMNSPFSGNQTRWEAAVDALVDTLAVDEDLLTDQLQIGVLRFGHDPDPGAPGTAIAGDASGLLDGQHLDLGFYDPLAPDKAYLQCNGDAVKDALLAVQSPLGGQQDGIESWTGGALARAQAYLQQTAADHPLDLDTRDAAIVLVTDGPWTDPSGTTPLAPATADPALVAADLFNNSNMSVRTYVLALGEAADEPWADAIGVAGGTGPARLGLYPDGLRSALGAVVDDFSAQVRLPRCSPAMARAMVLLDASSSMLNINGLTQAGPMGTTGWDQVRDALSGFPVPLFQRPVLASTREHFTLFGLAVFGHHEPAPGEQKLLVDYGLCHRSQFDWALDPETSCEPPGCLDPWGGPPLTWTFKTGDQAEPPFTEPVVSHMPRCDHHPNNPEACTGSGTHLHLGLQLVQDHFTAYKAACLADDAAMPCTEATPFINILIVDGAYNSSDAAVQAPLEAMHAVGVTTRVIGFGDIVSTPQAQAQLAAMASWGSGGLLPHFHAKNQMQLELALAAIADPLPADPCCDTRVCVVQSRCGDGIVDPGEQCDDGNNAVNDGCKPNCFLEPPDETTGDETTTTGDETTTTGDTSTTSDTTTDATSTSTTSTTDALTGTTSTSTTTLDPTTSTSTTSTATTLVPTSDGPPTTQGPGETSDASTGSSTSTTDPAGTGGSEPPESCSCTSDSSRTPGPALLLALAALARRRRRC